MKRLGAALFFWFAAFAATCQAPSSGGTLTQFQKNWELGPHIPSGVEQRDGSLDDPAVLEYLQRIEGRVATAAGEPPLLVCVTRGKNLYVLLRPNRVLYLSGGLLGRLDDEAELAGLLAHELAHIPREQGAVLPPVNCALTSQTAASGFRETERQATKTAIAYLKAAGYDPAGLLDLFSQLAYEQPCWAKAISPDDLLDVRTLLEAETIPPPGYLRDSSAFRQVHDKVVAVLSNPIHGFDTAVLRKR